MATGGKINVLILEMDTGLISAIGFRIQEKDSGFCKGFWVRDPEFWNLILEYILIIARIDRNKRQSYP